jgi:hypothetical protein
MARVDFNGVPEVEARTSAPDDYQHIQASPEAFGAGIATGLETVGQGLGQVSKFYGQVAADDATNSTLSQVGDILHGKAGQMAQGPDGTPIADTGFFGLRGAAAMSSWQPTQKAIDQVIQRNRQSLKTPEAQYQYDVDTRRYRAQWLSQIGTHADEQQRIWAKDTNDTAATIAANDLGRAPLDDSTVDDATDRLARAYVRNAQLAGLDPSGAVLKAHQEAALTRIRALVGSDDPQNRIAASKVLEDSRDVLGSLPNYDGVVREVKQARVSAVMAPALDQEVASALSGVHPMVGAPRQGVAAPQDVSAAIGTQEWHGNGPAPTSVDGAVGPSQITPDTARRYGLDSSRLNDPAYAAHARDVIVQHLAALPNVQGDPARIAVGYFSGPSNIAPPGSPTPYLHDAKDGNGKSVSSYVADVARRLQKYPSTADAIQANTQDLLVQAQQHAEKLFPNDPDVQEQFVERFRRRLDVAVTQQHQQYEVDTHTIQVLMASDNPPMSEEELESKGPDVARAWQNVQFNNPYAAMGIQRMFDANARGRAIGYGSDFKDYLDRALGSGPDRISDPSQLWPYVGGGEDAALTNTGVKQLTTLLGLRSTPQGNAQAGQIRAFSDQAYGMLTYANKGAGLTDPKGEQAFGRFMAAAMPVMVTAAKAGTLDKVLNPKSPDYLGHLAQTFMRTPAQVVADRLSGEKLTGAVKGPMTPDKLKQAVAMGQIPRSEGEWIAQQLGYIQGAGAATPPAQPTKPPLPLAAQQAQAPNG